jgi:hypothetical protein
MTIFFQAYPEAYLVNKDHDFVTSIILVRCQEMYRYGPICAATQYNRRI